MHYGFRIPSRRNTIAMAVGLALGTSAGAQEASPGVTEEVIVIGSRATLASAIAKQRDSDKIAAVIDSTS